MSVHAKLQKWLEAGLITADQKARILDHEKTYSGNRWRSGVGGAGLISILLGIALIIASNWQLIPWQTKIGAHFLINVILTTLVWQWKDNPTRDNHREIALGALWGLTLTFIGLMGQTFQLGGHAYEAVRLWFWLTTPMILLFAQSRGIARIWAIAFVLYVPYDVISWTLDHTQDKKLQQTICLALAVLLPLEIWTIGAIPRIAVNRPTIARMLRRMAVLITLVAAGTASLSFYGPHTYDDPIMALLMALIVILARFVLRARHPSDEDRGDIDIMCLGALFACLPFIVPIKSDIVAAVHFIALCLLVGALYQQQGKSRQVSTAISLVTMRLCVAFVQLFGTLMMSGFGFIIAGVVLMGLVRLGKYLDKTLKARIK